MAITVSWKITVPQCLKDLSKHGQYIYDDFVNRNSVRFFSILYSFATWKVGLLCVATPGSKFSFGICELD